MKSLKFNFLFTVALISLSQGASIASNDEEQSPLSFHKSINGYELKKVLEQDSVDELIKFGKSVRIQPEINSHDFLLFLRHEDKSLLFWAKKYNSNKIINFIQSLHHSHNIIQKTLSFLDESNTNEVDPREVLYDNMAKKENEIRNRILD
jgi:hypothetical protein